MRVPAIAMTHPLLGRVERDHHDLIERSDDFSSIFVKIDSIRLGHDGDEHQFRPFVRIKGQLDSIKPSYRLPGAVSELTFPDESGPSVDVRYDFTTEQMIAMIEKGFFEEGFGFVDGVRGDIMELNAPVDYKISREYDEHGLDVPVVFFDVPDRTYLRIDEPSSGYDFVDYLDLPDKTIENYMEKELESEFGVKKDIFAELHAQYEHEGEASFEKQYDVDSPEVDQDEFERARSAVQERQLSEAPVLKPELSEADRLYEESIAPVVESSIPTAERVESTLQVPEFDDLLQPETPRSGGMDLGTMNFGSLHATSPSQPEIDEDWLFETSSSEHAPKHEMHDAPEVDERETDEPNAAAVEGRHAEHEHDDVEREDKHVPSEHDGARRSVDDIIGSVETPIFAATAKGLHVSDLDADDLDAGEKAEADASKVRMAAMLAEHARQAEIAEAAHRLGVKEKDVSPDA